MFSQPLATRHFKLYAAAMMLAALVIALLAVNFAAGPIQAQNADGSHPDPQPCGPGAAKVADNPDKQITSGHYALFDAYWWKFDKNAKKSGTLNNNLCPPTAVHKDVQQGPTTVEVTTRTATNVDIGETVIHIGDKHKVTVVNNTNAINNNRDENGNLVNVGANEINLAEYPFIKDGLADEVVFDANGTPTMNGQPVQAWWLRLDDPDIAGDDSSDLKLGFSAGLFDAQWWYLEDEEGNSVEPLQYEFESERDAIDDNLEPHFFAFEKPKEGNAEQKDAIWNKTDADTNELKLWPGQYNHRQWVFTQPGTYVLQVHIKGHVRQKAPDGAASDWEPLHPEDKTVTSEVKRYTIQVGDLTLVEPPWFLLLERTLREDTQAGTAFGDPIPVQNPDKNALTFTLEGYGADKFSASPVTGGAQLAVAGNANLADEKVLYYDLRLGVSDGKDREGNRDPSVDDSVAVRIHLTDAPPSSYAAIMRVSSTRAAVGDDIDLRLAWYHPPGQIRHKFAWIDPDGREDEVAGGSATWKVNVSKPGKWTFYGETWTNTTEGTQTLVENKISSNRVEVFVSAD